MTFRVWVTIRTYHLNTDEIALQSFLVILKRIYYEDKRMFLHDSRSRFPSTKNPFATVEHITVWLYVLWSTDEASHEDFLVILIIIFPTDLLGDENILQLKKRIFHRKVDIFQTNWLNNSGPGGGPQNRLRYDSLRYDWTHVCVRIYHEITWYGIIEVTRVFVISSYK